MGGVADIITRVKFYVFCFSGFRIVTRPVLPFSIGLVALTTVLQCDTNVNTMKLVAHFTSQNLQALSTASLSSFFITSLTSEMRLW